MARKFNQKYDGMIPSRKNVSNPPGNTQNRLSKKGPGYQPIGSGKGLYPMKKG